MKNSFLNRTLKGTKFDVRIEIQTQNFTLSKKDVKIKDEREESVDE